MAKAITPEEILQLYESIGLLRDDTRSPSRSELFPNLERLHPNLERLHPSRPRLLGLKNHKQSYNVTVGAYAKLEPDT